MQKLYLDCDGVILDTINKSYKLLEEKNITDEAEKAKFYIGIDWDDFIIYSGEIDDSISKIKKLTNSFDIKILTHVHSENEGEAKIRYFAKVLPEVSVITVPKTIEKCDMVNPEGSILVDDFYPNLQKWEQKGGIPVKFSNSNKKYNCYTISSLLELLDIDFNKK